MGVDCETFYGRSRASGWRPWPSAFPAPIPRAATIRRRLAAPRCGGRACWSAAQGRADPAGRRLCHPLEAGRPGQGVDDRRPCAAWRDYLPGRPAPAASVLAQHRLAEAQSVVRGRGRALSAPARRGDSPVKRRAVPAVRPRAFGRLRPAAAAGRAARPRLPGRALEPDAFVSFDGARLALKVLGGARASPGR